MQKRPNILFLMSDEHRADMTGYEGNEVVRTPVLDSLARDGVVFRNAYTPSPICIPGRQAMMTGKFPRHCNCEVYGEDIAPGSMTFARRFAQYAYHTVCCGKLHHYGPDQMQGWVHRPAGDLDIGRRFIEGAVDEEFDRYQPQPGTGGWTIDKEVFRAGVGRSPYQMRDESFVEAAKHVLDRHYCDSFYDKPSPLPLLLKVSFHLPHYPFFCDEEKFSYYLNRVSLFDQPDQADPLGITPDWGIPAPPTERDARRAVAACHGLVETIDGLYGDVLERLRHVGQDPDDWIIIYTSDHGEMLGEHGCWWKNSFYEGSVRVPLIIRWPKRFEPRVVDENVNLCDLFATLCDLAGLPTPDGLDSRSLVPLMEGRTDDWDNETVSQFFGRDIMIKRGDLKYMDVNEHAGHREVLFDLASDPGEHENVIDAPQHAEAVAAFRRRRDELGFAPAEA